jgi:hypothetical protein
MLTISKVWFADLDSRRVPGRIVDRALVRSWLKPHDPGVSYPGTVRCDEDLPWARDAKPLEAALERI